MNMQQLKANRFNRHRHSFPSTMVIEAMEQNLLAVKLALQNTTSVQNGSERAFGILGYPAAILMFSIVDTIGSHFRKSKSQPLMIVGNGSVKISCSGDQHFYILNSEYFNLELKKDDIKAFYKIGRNALTHNSLIGEELTLAASHDTPFLEVCEASGKGKYVVHLHSFYEACANAITLFKLNKDTIFENSINAKMFPLTRGK